MANIISKALDSFAQKRAQAITGRYYNMAQLVPRAEFGSTSQDSQIVQTLYSKIGVDVASAEFKIVQKNENEAWEEVTNTPLANALQIRPNVWQTPSSFWTEVVIKMLKFGSVAISPVWKRYDVTELHICDSWEYVENSGDMIVEFELKGKTIRSNIEDIIIIENPKKKLTMGFNDITKLIDLHLQCLQIQMANGGNGSLSGFLKLPNNLATEEQLQFAQKRLDMINSTVSKGSGFSFLVAGEEVQEMNRDHKDVSKDIMDWLKDYLMESFGLSSDLLSGNYTQVEFRNYIESVVQPILDTISQELNFKLLTPTARTKGVEIQFAIPLGKLVSYKELSDSLYNHAWAGNMTANEVRSQLGYQPIDGGDKLMTNANAVEVNPADNNSAITEGA